LVRGSNPCAATIPANRLAPARVRPARAYTHLMSRNTLERVRGRTAARPNPRDATLEWAAGRLVTAERLLPPKGPIVVGVSGGPDSMALLHYLGGPGQRARPAPDLVAGHVNHGLRGGDADADEAFVRAQCGAWGIPFRTASVDPRARARARHESMEQAARALRYAALRGMAAQAGADRVAVAHTADDQAETILFRLVRGSGLLGLSGMRPRGRVQGGTVVRPLLTTTREQVLDYLARHGVRHREDATNGTLGPSRNYLRHEILPRLAARLNPSIRETLLREGRLFAEADAYLGLRARRALPRVLMHRGQGKIALDAARLRPYPKVLQKYVLRSALRKLCGEVLDLSYAHIEALLSLLEAPSGTSVDIANGIRAYRERGNVMWLVRSDEPRWPDPQSKA
jgi:tRNA(Ile)-lysidine synthase